MERLPDCLPHALLPSCAACSCATRCPTGRGQRELAQPRGRKGACEEEGAPRRICIISGERFCLA